MLRNLGDYAEFLTVEGQGWYHDEGVAIVPVRFTGIPNRPFLLTVGDGWVYSHNLLKQIPIRKRYKGDYNGPKSLFTTFHGMAETLQTRETRESRKRELENHLRSVFPQAFAYTFTPPDSIVLRVAIDPGAYTPDLEKTLQDLFLKLAL